LLTPLNLPKGETFCIHYEILIHFAPPMEGLGEVKRRIKQLRHYIALITYNLKITRFVKINLLNLNKRPLFIHVVQNSVFNTQSSNRLKG